MTVLGMDYLTILKLILIIFVGWDFWILSDRKLPPALIIISLSLLGTSFAIIAILARNPDNYALYHWARGLLFSLLVFTLIIRAIGKKGDVQ